jgi:N-acetyl sugar amidotransferase
MSINQIYSVTNRPYQQCTRCVMDTTAPNIAFDNNGVCNFCAEFLQLSAHIIYEDEASKLKCLRHLVASVRQAGKSKPYDCIVGVSGGVDSSWTLVQVKRLGLRPLAVHMDNGWNSELAQNNIANLITSLGVDLYTHVIDWNEYKALMQAFFDADVIDVELLYDNAMLGVCFKQARKYDLKYILSGSNQVTEGIQMPKGWNWYKRDALNIKSIAHKYGRVRPRTFPAYSTLDYLFDEIRDIRWIPFLDFLPFNKSKAMAALESSYGYKRYPFKHYESIFTRFYQGYILPRKFGVDKRLLHLSTLVASGQMSRDEALVSLEGIPYPSLMDLEDDVVYFLKKMMWTQSDLEAYIQRPGISHDAYPSEAKYFAQLSQMVNRVPRLKKVIRALICK